MQSGLGTMFLDFLHQNQNLPLLWPSHFGPFFPLTFLKNSFVFGPMNHQLATTLFFSSKILHKGQHVMAIKYENFQEKGKNIYNPLNPFFINRADPRIYCGFQLSHTLPNFPGTEVTVAKKGIPWMKVWRQRGTRDVQNK